MSGIVGIVNLDGEPVDRELLGRMTDYMTFRGPDTQQIWIEGNVGFGYTQLKTTWEMEYEWQPFTLDQQVWIVADARIDDRETLAAKLDLPFRPLTISPPLNENKPQGVITDVELILRSYFKWGEGCVQHLLGDFSFAIWDSRKQQLFCARDQLGVKLFYYSHIDNCLIISNTLNCIRQHPKISRALNQAAIGDFLLFDMNYNLEITTFTDIQRLPPAHTLVSTGDNSPIKCYWSLPLPEQTRYKNSQDYIDQFNSILGKAVADRLRIKNVSLFCSGGLDSNAIAATALRVTRQKSQPLSIDAYTAVYDQIIPDQERYYSGIAAAALTIPIHYLVGDNYKLYQDWDQPELHQPEPNNEPLSGIRSNQLKQMAIQSRVALYGEGGDEALKGENVVELLAVMPPFLILKDLIITFFKYKLFPPIGSGIYVFLRRNKVEQDRPAFPSWLNSNFVTALNLKERWQEIRGAQPITLSSPRGKAYQALTSPLWQGIFETYDPGYNHINVETRLPFMDILLLNYCLSLPPLPWCIEKQLTRRAMANMLPIEVIQRPKTPLAGDPVSIKFAQAQISWHNQQYHPALQEFIDLKAFDLNDSNFDNRTVWNAWERLRVVSLNRWLTKY
uniref:asparagine synthase (glutamine-hydrolyzing) n=1 Tax=Cyanothece sp. (strain PCC 7425 / ATCC 29141) TaxID=395961 RepID=B8HXX3_CYAP4